MSDVPKIRSVVARFFNVPESDVTEEFVFPRDRLQGSVGRTTFHAALKRLAGADLPAAMTAINFRELLAPPSAQFQLTQSQPTSPPQANGPTPAPATGLSGTDPSGTGHSGNGPSGTEFGVGIDIESVESLPATNDPWSDPFYRDNFTEAEIAYCRRQSDPRMSFCGIWSAKEAAMKCDPEIAGLRPVQIEITHDEQRRPGLRLHGPVSGGDPVDYVVSISHAGQTAVAVCVRKPKDTNLTRGAHDATPFPTLEERAGERRPIRAFLMLNLALSLLAILLWAITWATRK
jgi:phosphopantetheine--protein transferase-like protein